MILLCHDVTYSDENDACRSVQSCISTSGKLKNMTGVENVQ